MIIDSTPFPIDCPIDTAFTPLLSYSMMSYDCQQISLQVPRTSQIQVPSDLGLRDICQLMFMRVNLDVSQFTVHDPLLSFVITGEIPLIV